MLGAVPPTPPNLKALVAGVANQYGVEPALVFAHIHVESSWNPMAQRGEPRIGDASWGLMQVLQKTARQISGNKNLTVSELLKPETNVLIGVKYIAQNLKRYNNDYDKAIAAYNAGSARYKKDGSFINQDYVNKVKRWLTFYRAEGTIMKAGLPIMGIVAIGALVGITLISNKS